MGFRETGIILTRDVSGVSTPDIRPGTSNGVRRHAVIDHWTMIMIERDGSGVIKTKNSHLMDDRNSFYHSQAIVIARDCSGLIVFCLRVFVPLVCVFPKPGITE